MGLLFADEANAQETGLTVSMPGYQQSSWSGSPSETLKTDEQEGLVVRDDVSNNRMLSSAAAASRHVPSGDLRYAASRSASRAEADYTPR